MVAGADPSITALGPPKNNPCRPWVLGAYQLTHSPSCMRPAATTSLTRRRSRDWAHARWWVSLDSNQRSGVACATARAGLRLGLFHSPPDGCATAATPRPKNEEGGLHPLASYESTFRSPPCLALSLSFSVWWTCRSLVAQSRHAWQLSPIARDHPQAWRRELLPTPRCRFSQRPPGDDQGSMAVGFHRPCGAAARPQGGRLSDLSLGMALRRPQLLLRVARLSRELRYPASAGGEGQGAARGPYST